MRPAPAGRERRASGGAQDLGVAPLEEGVQGPALAPGRPGIDEPALARVRRRAFLLHEGGAGSLAPHRSQGLDERGEMGTAELAAEALVQHARESVGHRDADQPLEWRQRVRADAVGMSRHDLLGAHDGKLGEAHRERHPHVVDDARTRAAKTSRARPAVARPPDCPRPSAHWIRLEGVDPDGTAMDWCSGLAHRARASLRMASISAWIWPFDAIRAGAARSSGPPSSAVTRPPASSTSSAPAAASHGPSTSSQ